MTEFFGEGNNQTAPSTESSVLKELKEKALNTDFRGGEDQPLKAAIGSKRLTYKLPENDENTNHFVNFIISKQYEYNARQVKEPEVTITLPLPQNLQTGYRANYNNTEIGPLGNLFAEGAAQSTGTIGDIANKSLSQFKGNFSGATGMNLLTQFLESDAAGIATGLVANRLGPFGGAAGFGAGQLASGAVKGSMAGLGVTRNPHMAVLCSGPDLRTHSFQYKIVPKNVQEQNTLANVISLFKQAMMPEYIHANQFFRYPRQFDIQIPMGSADLRNPYFFSIATSVLESFDVDYQPDGPYYHDVGGMKAPVAVALNMTFREVTMTTRRTTQPYNEDIGVGFDKSSGGLRGENR